MPLMSNFEELEEFNKKHVNPVTGTIFKKSETKMNTDRERIRQIEAKALKKLKEKSSQQKLDDYID